MNPVTMGAWAVIATAVAVAVSLQWIVAPYGRHARPGWGPTLPSPIAWTLMECPSVLVYLAVAVATGGSPVLGVIWLSHYVYRAFVYPYRGRPGRPMPASVAAMGASFNVVNATLNASIPAPDPTWWTDPRFVVGVILFYAGMALNHDADARLRRLSAETAADGVRRYAIPTGGAYRWVSCPNYLGEIVQWSGWALLTWSMPGLAFALFTAANLVPRGYSHHRWYRATFPDYPPERTAVFPGIGPR